MTTPLVTRQDQDGLALLTLNRPDKLNSLTVGMVRDLQADESIGCVILKGAGKCFSAGHDLGDIAEGESVPSPGWHSETLRLMERLPKPVIAAVHGHCYTGALEVALAADFIIAAESARFGDTHAKWALTPIWGMSQRLPRRVGVATAKRLMFTADMIGADEAFRIGLVEQVVADAAAGEVRDVPGRAEALGEVGGGGTRRHAGSQAPIADLPIPKADPGQAKGGGTEPAAAGDGARGPENFGFPK